MVSLGERFLSVLEVDGHRILGGPPLGSWSHYCVFNWTLSNITWLTLEGEQQIEL